MKYVTYLFLLLSMPTAFGQIFKGESVEYDSVGHRFLTSDNGSSIVQRAADGTISLFGSGTKADYGMEIMNNVLFTVSGSKVYAYDLTTETELAAISISGASFLNGLGSDGSHLLWVTDYSSGKIHQIDVTDLAAPVVTLIVASYGGAPNGIVHDAANNRLVVATWGANAPIKAIDLGNNYAISTLTTTNLTNIDGIDMDDSSNFFIASWSPDKIYKYNNDFSVSQEIVVAGLNNPADICYSVANDTLAIPNTAGNNILFVSFVPPPIVSAATDLATKPFSVEVSPNPATSDSNFRFVSPVSGVVKFRITDVNGKVVFERNNVAATVGENSLSLRDFSGSAGTYFCFLAVGSVTKSCKMFVVD